MTWPLVVLLCCVSVLVGVVALRLVMDFAAHVSRYRGYRRMYPATRTMRGRVWKAMR